MLKFNSVKGEKMLFVCPDCKGTQIEEVMTDCTQYSDITEIYEDEGNLEYGDNTIEGGYVVR